MQRRIEVRFGIDDQFRMSEVKRWHVINVTREQTLADHSFQVAMLTRTIIASLEPHWSLGDAYLAVMMAMTHDAHETWLGDTPTCAKEFQFSDQPDFRATLFGDVEGGLNKGQREIANKVIKLADTMEALVWLSQNRTGTHANRVLEEITSRWTKILEESKTWLPLNVAIQLAQYVQKVRGVTEG